MKKKAFCFIVCVFFVSLSTMGQNQKTDDTSVKKSETKVDLQRTIRLEKNSKSEEIIIEIKQETKRFELFIQSTVNNGKLTIEVYDPNDTRQGNFTVGTQLNSEKKEVANGNIRKSLVEPQAGKWKVKIFPVEASGNINIRTAVIE